MKKFTHSFALAVIMIAFATSSKALENIGSPHKLEQGHKVEAGDCHPATANIDLNINNVRARLMNGGDMWWDLNSTAKYEVPKVPIGSTDPRVSSVFAGSVWIGGIDQGGQLKVAAGTYRQNGNDFFPGPLDANGEVDQSTCSEFDKEWQVLGSEIDEYKALFTSVGQVVSTSQVPQNILNWPANGNPYAGFVGNRDLAPFYDYDGNGTYDPTTGDFPVINSSFQNYADQMIWWVYNDKGNIHTETGGQAIGMEVQALAFAFKTTDEIDNMTFYKYVLLNKATTTLDSVYMGQWVDPDLGCYTDDYIGCDTSRGLGIIYNADANDQPCPVGYGNQPPMLGVDYFKGPLDENGVELGMTKFLYYNNDFTVIGNPENASHYYGYLSGSWKDGTPFTEGGNGHGGSVPTDFVFPGVPNDPTSWSECSENNTPADRRFVESTGAFKLLPGASNEIIVGVVWVRPPVGTYPCPSFSLLQTADDKAQALFDSNFKILDGPKAPDVSIVELDKKVIVNLLNTNSKDIEKYKDSDPILVAVNDPDSIYNFQGYQIFQLINTQVSAQELGDPSKSRLVAQSDLKDGVSKIVNFTYDPNLESDVPTLKVDGANLGVSHSVQFENDAFATGDKRLVNNKKYYYMVVSYAYNGSDIQKTKYLQGRKNTKIYTAIPHIPAPEFNGLIINSEYGDGPQITRQEGTGNGGNELDVSENALAEILTNGYAPSLKYAGGKGPVVVKVIDPKNVPDANFELDFRDTTLFSHWKSYKVKDTVTCSHITVGGHDSTYNCIDTILGGVHAIVGGLDTIINGNVVIIGGHDTILGGLDTTICSHITVGTHDSAYGCVNSIKYYPSTYLTSDTTVRDTSLLIVKSSSAKILDDTATWTLKMLNGDSVVSEKTILVGNEQMIPDWGLSVYIEQVRNPGSKKASDHNGYIDASITFAEPQTTWLSGVPDQEGEDDLNWIRSGTFNPTNAQHPDYVGEDDNQDFEKILGGTVAPYHLCSTDPDWGPIWSNSATRIQNRLDSLPSIKLVYTSDKSKWTHCLVLESQPEKAAAEGNAPKMGIRYHGSLNKDGTYQTINTADPFSVGYSWFPGYAIDLETGTRLNIMFAEDSRNIANNGADMIWNPTSTYFTSTGEVALGGRHFIYIARSQYDEDVVFRGDLALSSGSLNTQTAAAVYKNIAWVGMPMLATGFQLKSFADGLIPTETTIFIWVNRAYSIFHTGNVETNGGFPKYTFSTSGLAAVKGDMSTAQNALDTINIVPNPYYAYSGYESSQVDNRVKITNLPQKCTISIFSVDGTLIRRFDRDDNSITSLDWDLKNNAGVPISSGVYLIHINAGELGEKTLKWFGIMRPIDLDSF